MTKSVWVLLSALAILGCGDDEKKGGDRSGNGRDTSGVTDDDTRSPDAGPSDPGGSSDVDPADAKLVSDAAKKLVECGLYDSASDVPEEQVADDFDRCLLRCIDSAPCNDLVTFICDVAESAYTQCLSRCSQTPSDGFECDDRTRIPHQMLCDGEADCKSGEDELDCEYVCADGTRLPEAYDCDGTRDCPDGSDEDGCPVCKR